MTSLDSRSRWLALLIVCLGDLMIVLDVTIVGVALPSIREDLDFSETSLAWVVNAYLLTFGGFLLLGGRLGDLFGHRRLFIAGIGLFTAASLACGLAGSQAALDRRPLGARTRRRDRLGRRAVAHRDAVHRACRACEGDGRVRVRRRRRRVDRRASRRDHHGRARLELDLPRQRPDRHRRRRLLADRASRRSRFRSRYAARRRRRSDRDGVADACGLRDRQRERGGLGHCADAGSARRRSRS